MIYQLDTFVSPQREPSTLTLAKQMEACISYTGVSRRTKRPFTFSFVTPWNTALLGKQSSSASQEIPRILWNPNAHYRMHKRPSLAPFLVWLHPVHAQPSYFMKIHCNIDHPSTSRCWKRSLSFMFFHQNPVGTSRISYVPHASTISFLITPVMFYDSTSDEDNSPSSPLHSPS